MTNKNIMMLCLDSCRYDTFEAAEAPNMKAIGELKTAYSNACWTVPSMVSYLMGSPPIGITEGHLGGGDVRTSRPRFLTTLFDCELMRWVPREYMKKKYYTIFKSQNAALANYTSLGSFHKGFMDYNSYTKLDPKEVTETIAVDLEEKVLQVGAPVFAVILLMDTHAPFHWGEGTRVDWMNEPKTNFDNQVKAIEYVDRIFPRLIAPFTGVTDVIITSDHGDLFGPEYYGHSPSYPLRFHEDLFKIPFIRGEIGEEKADTME